MVTWNTLEQKSDQYRIQKADKGYLDNLLNVYINIKEFCIQNLAEPHFIRYEIALSQSFKSESVEFVFPSEITKITKTLSWHQLVNNNSTDQIGCPIDLTELDKIIVKYQSKIHLKPSHIAQMKNNLQEELNHHESYFPSYHFSVYDEFNTQHLAKLAIKNPFMSTFQIKSNYEY